MYTNFCMGKFPDLAEIVRHRIYGAWREMPCPKGWEQKENWPFVGVGYDDDSAFGCTLIIARLVSLRRSLARLYR